MTGFPCGTRERRRRAIRRGRNARQALIRRAPNPRHLGLSLFLDEELGYTSVAVALALTVSLALVLTLAQVQWVGARAADVQAVADSAALSGAQVVKAYTLVAEVTDACVLTLGLGGLFVMGAGLIVCAVPGMASAGLRVVDAGGKIMDARKDFATSAAENLAKLEECVPALIAADSFVTVQANNTGAVGYAGVAIPFPEEGQSDFDLADEVEADDLEGSAEELGEASDEAKAAKEALDKAQEKGWRADCVDDPLCMRSRAASLAGLSDAQNPNYEHPQGWNFGVALSRARAYYAARLAQEAPASNSVEERANSAMRKVFYAYALQEVNDGHYRQNADGSVSMDLPSLAHNSAETRSTSMYTQTTWPCTQEAQGKTIHAFAECPGAKGASAGRVTLAQMDAGAARECDVCHMSTAEMGRVASASTNISNGFEHYWRIVVEASHEWSAAKADLDAAEEAMRAAGEEGANAFDEALKALAVPRPKLCPPGAWGCIAVVVHGEVESPEALASAFTGEAALPAGAAISAATLAPDEATAENNILSRFFDSVSEGQDGGIEGVLQGITGMWGQLLVGYGSAAEGISGAARSLFDGLESIGLGAIADWLSDTLTGIVEALGFQPADMRIKKPVLCNSQDVLDKDGSTQAADVRRYLQAMPADGDVGELLGALGREFATDIRDVEFTVAELPIPGTSLKIPLTVSLGGLGLV